MYRIWSDCHSTRQQRRVSIIKAWNSASNRWELRTIIVAHNKAPVRKRCLTCWITKGTSDGEKGNSHRSSAGKQAKSKIAETDLCTGCEYNDHQGAAYNANDERDI